MAQSAQYWIRKLRMKEHPEGGHYAQTYRSPISTTIDGFDGPRSLCSAIYFLLKGNDFSAFHRIKADEMWHFYSGSTLTIHVIDNDRRISKIRLGKSRGCVLQALISPGQWFAATVDNPRSFSLVGCTVAPAFDYADFELAERGKLIDSFPEHKSLITKMTRA